MPADDVDRAAFAEVRIRDLDANDETGCHQFFDRCGHERGVPFIEEAVEFAASPADFDRYLGIERLADTPQAPQRNLS